MRYLLLLIPCLLFGDLRLKDQLKQAEPGDYLVTRQGKNYSLLHIREVTDKSITIEEIGIGGHVVSVAEGKWPKWAASGAPKHSSWLIYEIDFSTGKMLRSYSFTDEAWADLSYADSFLSTLLNLKLEQVPPEKRKRLGRPSPGKGAERPFWQPKLIFQGQSNPHVRFTAWQAKWPKDGTELADKNIEVYLPEENSGFPSYFPYWVEVSNQVASAKLRIVDSGKALQSVKKGFPSRR